MRLTVRRNEVSFDDLDRHWFGGNALLTHVSNALHLLFPAGERFFMRSVRLALGRIEEPALERLARGFCAQEGQHAAAHERCFEALERQGFRVRGFLALYEGVAFGFLTSITPRIVHLSVTVALEHFTATLADLFLTTKLLDKANPAMRRLLAWHAAEEIEHKAVAFDVLRATNGGYLVRLAGVVIATFWLGVFWALATGMLLWQDPDVTVRRLWRDVLEIRRERPGGTAFFRGILDYLRPGFHPWQHDNRHLARQALRDPDIASAVVVLAD